MVKVVKEKASVSVEEAKVRAENEAVAKFKSDEKAKAETKKDEETKMAAEKQAKAKAAHREPASPPKDKQLLEIEEIEELFNDEE